MKKLLIAIPISLILAAIVLLFAFQYGTVGPNFSGKWHVETETSSFDLNLSQVNNILSGSHCSVQKGGNKIDCVLDDTDVSLTGTVGDSDSAVVTFTSQLSLKNGTASIKKISDTEIQWKIISDPQGSFFIPDQATLTKQN